MNVWLAQKNQEIASCQRCLQRFRREIAFDQKGIRAARLSIKIEQQQMANARRARDEGRRDLREYLKGK